MWGPSLGLQPAPPLGTSVCACVCVCVCVRAHASVTRSCPTLCDPTDCSPPGSSGSSRQEYSAGCHLLPQGPPEGTLVLTAVFLAVGSLPESLLQLTLPPPQRWPLTKDPRGGTPTRPGLPVSGIQTGDLRAQPSVSQTCSQPAADKRHRQSCAQKAGPGHGGRAPAPAHFRARVCCLSSGRWPRGHTSWYPGKDRVPLGSLPRTQVMVDTIHSSFLHVC